MTDESHSIKINFAHLLGVFLIIFLFVILGFIWDKLRTQKKLKVLEAHIDRVYKVRTTDIREIIQMNDPFYSYKLLRSIKDPESPTYTILLYKKTGVNWFAINENYDKGKMDYKTFTQIASADEVKQLENLSQKDVSSTTSLVDGYDYHYSPRSWMFTGNWLHASRTIRDESGKVIGLVVLRVNKNQDVQ